jgi:hypothetical protein
MKFKAFLIILIALVTALTLPSCHNKNKHKEDVYNVQSYKVSQSDGTWLYYYVLLSDRGGYYYYSSTVQTNSFTGVQFTQSSTLPFDQSSAEQLPSIEVEPGGLPGTVESNVTETEVEVNDAGQAVEGGGREETEHESNEESSPSEGESNDSGGDAGSSSDGGGSGD